MATVDVAGYGAFRGATATSVLAGAGVYGVPDVPESSAINLLSAAPAGPTTLVLTFDRPPAGAVTDPASYSVSGGGYPMAVISAAFGTPDPGETYPRTVRLTTTKGTDGESYSVTVAGIEGACGEVLGVDTQTWVSVGTGPSVMSAAAVPGSITVVLSEPVDPATIGGTGDWTLAGTGTPTITGVVAGSSTTAILSIIGTLRAGWIVTAPATLTDVAGNVADPAHRSAFVTVPASVGAKESGNPWGATGDGGTVDLGSGPYEMVPWAAGAALVSLVDAVWISLFTDRRAGADDAIPDTAGDLPYRGGWWADAYTDTPDGTYGPIGSRLWLLYRSPVNQQTVAQVREYAAEALAWMVRAGVAARVDVSVQRVGRDGIALSVVVSKRDGSQETVRFPDLWDALAQQAA